jgi:hypothetical protein
VQLLAHNRMAFTTWLGSGDYLKSAGIAIGRSLALSSMGQLCKSDALLMIRYPPEGNAVAAL